MRAVVTGDAQVFDAFLSYSRDDENRVLAVQQALERHQLQVWRDRGQIRPGDAWIEKLESGLGSSRCVILFCSRSAVVSEWVQREWNVALTVRLPIVPVRLDDAELPLMLKPLQCVDLLSADLLDDAVDQIMSAIRGVAAKRTPDRAEPHNANPSVLGPDVVILNRMITREGNAARRLELARWSAAAVGLAAAVALALFTGGAGALFSGALAVGTLIVAAAIAWAITAQARTNRSEMLRLSTIKDGIELYCPNQPACGDFRVKLESILKRRAGIEGGAA